MIKFDWTKFDYLGHKFIQHKETQNQRCGWSVCLICGVFVYIDIESHFANEIRYWDDNLFHESNNASQRAQIVGVVTFDLTCSEVLIKKLLE